MTGASLSLVLVASYLAGGAAKTALAKSHAVHVATAQAASRGAARPQLAPIPAALNMPASPQDTLAEVRIARGQGDLNCLTDAVYYEARGESDRGQAAVAQVVLNRVRRAGFPKSVCGVVFQGASEHACQFSFACDGAMSQDREAAAWRRARSVAQRALDGAVMEDVGDATNFHVARLGQIWGSGLVRVAQVGAHVFYRLTGHGTFVAHPAGPHDDDSQDDSVTAIPADGGGEQASLILASAVTIKPLGEGGPAGPAPEPTSAPAAPAVAKAAAPAAKPPASPVAPVSTAPKADG